MAKDYYKILGVDRNATKEQVKAAYKRLAKQHHPDLNKDPGATEKFKEISEAAAVLGDEQKRSHYDQYGTADAPNFSGADFSEFTNIDDLFDSFFSGFGFGGFRRSHGKEGSDLQTEASITLDEVAVGAKRTIETYSYASCDDCNGRGGSGEQSCTHCRGTGAVKTAHRTAFGVFATQTTCSKCSGSGVEFSESCKTCKGQGRMKKSREIEVEIPAGIEDGMRLRLAGQGESGSRGGRNGDLFVFVHVKPDSRFERKGPNLFKEIAVPFHILCLGGAVDVETLQGKVELNIPSSTEDNTQFRLREKGLPSLREGSGDLVVKVHVDIPKKLTKEQKEALKSFGAKEKKGWLF